MSHEYSEGTVISNPDFEVSALKNIHPPVEESYAFKFRLDNKIIVFSGDTAYCTKHIPFSLTADYLIHEVLYV